MGTQDHTIIQQITDLKKKHKAVILAHNYQLAEVQDIADFTGDSLELSQKGAKVQAEMIIFCGVKFMAETAKILSPEKTVILANPLAGCPMADMITDTEVKKMKEAHPAAKVVCYVNSPVEVKAESDVCCTSANALKVVQAMESDEIIFVPDMHLGHFVSRLTDKVVILSPGYCPTHVRILPEYIEKRKEEFPDAMVIVHPETPHAAARLADKVLSTGGMCRYVQKIRNKRLIIGTEIGFLYRLMKLNPDNVYIPVTEQAICPNMKLITLEEVLLALLQTETHPGKIELDEEVRKKALLAVQRMLKIS